MRPVRAVAIGLVLLAGGAWPIAGPSGAACASDGPHAGLVVDNGSRTLELCVELDAASVSGLHLIEMAHEQLGLAYALGQGGQAVCRLDGVGPQGDDCFADYPDFWGYWHGDGHGGWTWSSVGGASYQVGDGALDAWVWGSGDTGATHPQPPPASATDVCPAPTPSPSATPTQPSTNPTPAHDPPPATKTTTTAAGGGGGTGAAGRAPTPTPSPAPPGRTNGDHARSSSASRGGSTTAAATAAGVVRAVGPPGQDGPPPDGGGPPAGLFLALGLAIALGAGGWLRMRSHQKGQT
jgi:hypothetical protein